jgi:hypothetical protein
MKTRWMKRKAAMSAVMALLAAAALPASAQVQGVIVRAGSGVQMRGDLRWRAATKQYEVKTANAPAYVPIALNQVADVHVAPPAGLEEACKAVERGATSGAPVATLERIVDDYLMLEHDLTAMRWLAEAYLRRGQGQQALDRFHRVMQFRDLGTVPVDTVRAYWQVLLAGERYSDLNRQLKAAIQQGSRPVQAMAQTTRGSMDMNRKAYRDALVDGFLRTIVLFSDVRDLQPEALYKAAVCFEELGESHYAEKMRKKLLTEFPNSTYSKEIHSGG